MKHFIYTLKEHKPPLDGSGIERTIRVYQIKRGVPHLIVSNTDTFLSGDDMFMHLAEKYKLLPKRCFRRYTTTNSYIHHPQRFAELGIATVVCI